MNYSWLADKNKVPTDTAEDNNNHGFDAVRYSVSNEFGAKYDWLTKEF